MLDKSYEYKMSARFNLSPTDSFDYKIYELKALGHMALDGDCRPFGPSTDCGSAMKTLSHAAVGTSSLRTTSAVIST